MTGTGTGPEETGDAVKEARHNVYGELMWPEWNRTSEAHGTSFEQANALLDTLIAAVEARTRERVAREIEAGGYSTGDLPPGQLGAWIDSRSRAARIARNGTEETT